MRNSSVNDALEAFSASIKMKESAEAFYHRGQAYFYKNEYDPAIADYTKAIELYPKNSSACKQRSKAFCSQGKKDSAQDDEKTVIELGGKVEQPCQ